MAESTHEPAPRVLLSKAGKRAGKLSVRGLVRALHRDLGHLAVGLTLVYALSGLAVNHILDWEPNFSSYQKTYELGGPLAFEDEAIAKTVIERLGVTGAVRDVYRAAPDDLQIVFERRTFHVDPRTGHVLEEGQNPRFFLRVANWLHVSRGKKAWTVVADLYAVGLIVLALSGLFMNTGRKGLWGRGGILLLLGALIPIVYVQVAGGPESQKGKPETESHH